MTSYPHLLTPALFVHPTAWVSRRGEDGKVTVSLFVPRTEGDKPSILVPKEAQRKNGTSPLSCCFQDSGPALPVLFCVLGLSLHWEGGCVIWTGC